DDVNAAIRRLEMTDLFTAAAKGSKYRLIKFEFLTPDSDLSGTLPSRFRATYYNYTKDISIVAEGDFAGGEPIRILEIAADPGASG
ncbi:hypothetical protein, partial [Vibrio cholerae]|uniref:hypothetical protein n=1 Tax=Vibrio cholerae TaxID=666 RepID=UPI0018F0C89F